METRYRILYAGRLLPGKFARDVLPELTGKFHLPEDKARSLIQGGHGRTIKRGLTQDEAERYRNALMQAGLDVLVEPEPGAAGGETGGEAASPLSFAKPRETAAAARCPKCGAEAVSELTGVCQSCGIVVERYLARQDQDEGDAGPGAHDPYQPPAADLTPPSWPVAEDELQDPRGVGFGRGLGWIADAWALFRQRPLQWIGALVVFYIVVVLVSLVPVLGGLASTILGPVLTGGLMLGAHAQQQGEEFGVGDVFAGVRERGRPLALLGLAYLLLAIAMAVVVGLLAMGAVAGLAGATGGVALDEAQAQALMMSPAMALPVLVALLLGIPLAMATFFAPALVAIEGVAIPTAFKLSLLGCLRNILPFLLFGVAALVLFVLGMIPVGLGLLIVLPVLTISVYTAYRDIFYG